METWIKINTKDDSEEQIHTIVSNLYNNKQTQGQQTLNHPVERKYYCNNPECKKEITKEVVAFCLHEDNKPRFNGKVYCRDCQLKFGGVSP